MSDRRTEVSVPQFFGVPQPTVFTRLPMEWYQQFVGLNAPFFENDGAYLLEHFLRYIGPIAPGTANGYVLSGATAEIASAGTSDVGIIRLQTLGAVGTVAQLEQQYGSAGLRIQGNRIAWCVSRFTPRDATQGAFFFGLGTPGTADVFTALPTNGFFFYKEELETSWKFHVRSGGVSTIIEPFTGALSNGSRGIGFLADRRNFAPFWQQETNTYSPTFVVFADDPNLPSDTNGFSFYWAVRRGASGDGRMDIDYSFWGSQDFTD